MSLTATARQSLCREVSDIVGMKHPVVVAVSPSKPNILYTIKHSDDFQQAFAPLVEGLKKERSNFPRTIIYCQKLSDCGRLYMHFRKFLGDSFTEPEDAPDLPGFQLVDMFHSCTDTEIKESIYWNSFVCHHI